MFKWTVFLIAAATGFTSASLAQDKWVAQEQMALNRILSLRLPEAFVQKAAFPWKAKDRVREIVYGNPGMGYFSSRNFAVRGGKVELTFIPPSYKGSIEFSAVLDDHRKINLGTRHYVHPLGSENVGSWAFTSMRPSFPFIITNWVFNDGDKAFHVVPVVFNRIGEVVWAYSTPELSMGKKKFDDSFEILEDGRFLLMDKYAATRVLIVDSFGKITKKINFAQSGIPYGNSHTVQYLKDSNEIVFLGFDCRRLEWWQEFTDLFRGPKGWWRLWKLPRRTYRGGRLLRMSLDDLKVKEVWNSFDSFSPAKNPNLGVGPLIAPDRSIDARSEDEYLNSKDATDEYYIWYDWPDKLCDVDWTHENSAQFMPGKGYLVSIRNLNKIILIGEDGRLKWSIGEGAENDFQLPRDGSGFSMQHSARFLPDGRILLYDNHSAYRMASGLRVGNRAMILNPKTPGPLQVEWSFMFHGPHSEVRGSVNELRNGNIFAYSAGNSGVASEIFEINPVTSRMVGRIQINQYRLMKGFEAKPFYSFGGDQFLAEAPSQTEGVAEPSRFLEFTY